MARKRAAPSSSEVKTTDYRHTGEKRPNIPSAKIAAEGKVPRVPKVQYYYNPHLAPVLRFDPTAEADELRKLVHEAARRPLQSDEVRKVSEAVHHYDPWLEWTGKREQQEKGYFEVDPVALHIHERVSAQAIVRTAMREDVQRDIFADPQQPYQEAIQFYKHPVDWSNRVILGDSLQVMSSLARRENLAGKVQMIYMDPPYGVDFSSNFQPELKRRDLTERDQDLTREAETVRAYRDTWLLGVHSYLSYLRHRFVVAQELLAMTGSIFVQIGEENHHRVRSLLEEVFGRDNFIAEITYRTSIGLGSRFLDPVANYIVWFAKDRESASDKYRPLFSQTVLGEEGATRYTRAQSEVTGEIRTLTDSELADPTVLPEAGWRPLTDQGLTSRSGSDATRFSVRFQGRDFRPTAGGWRTGAEGMARVLGAERVLPARKTIRFKKFFDDFRAVAVTNVWTDVGGGIQSREDPKIFAVQTATSIVQRCMLMSTDPGDLVLDPTCGSGTTAYVAEQWGRRWITIDTSRVAISLARQRILTARFDFYRLRGDHDQDAQDPSNGFVYHRLPHIELRAIARNANLDPILARHEPILDAALGTCNMALRQVAADLRRKLAAKLNTKTKREQAEADRRRWDLPEKFEHWTVPFDTDLDWPRALQDAVTAYRRAWCAKMDEVNRCIADNAEEEELVDQPEQVKRVVRVSGPFTVEGVRPEELSLGKEGLFDATPNEFDDETGAVEVKNINAYLTRLVHYLGADGLTFINNQRKKLARLEPLFESKTGSIIHAEGVWEGNVAAGPNTVGVGFGPQYGPVTALQVEELIRAAKRYDELVIAGFSFDAEATEVIQTQNHPKLRIHQAYIRPDINPAMEGLLKDTPSSQLFTVFGQPEFELIRAEDGEWVVKLVGVDIYNPIENTVRSSGADKVAAWFLDQDYDGRCFCITQAFFPDQDAWEKIAKALGSSADSEAFEKFYGTESLPFKAAKHLRIAVKVIDPRGNEVMAVRNLEA